jgi:predicted PurR-regulated permease PerM
MTEDTLQRILVPLISATIQGIVLKMIVPKIKDLVSIKQAGIVLPILFAITFVMVMIVVRPVKWQIEGTVSDANTGELLEGATIAIQEWTDLTGTDGRFLVTGESSRKPSKIRIRVEFEGYRPVTKFVRLNSEPEIALESR